MEPRFFRGRSFLTIKDARRATLQSSFALAHDDSSPSQGEPKQCCRPNASPCLGGGGTSGEAASDGRVRREKRRKSQRGETNKGNSRLRVWAHSLNDTRPQKRSFCAVSRQKCSKNFLQCILEKLFEFFCAFLLVRHKISSSETLRVFRPPKDNKTEDGSPSPVSFSAKLGFHC